MKRRTLILLATVLVAVLVANAAVFTYRTLTGTFNVADATQARGAACTGFYSSADQPGIENYLPVAGTNYNAATYGGNSITVTPGEIVCQWADANGNTYQLYGSIQVDIPVTVGSWYIKDFYGFGYNGTNTDPTIYVDIIVEQAVDTTVISDALLLIYNASDGSLITTIDLTQVSPASNAYNLTLKPGEAYQLDLQFTATGTGTTSFLVGFYASESQEDPR